MLLGRALPLACADLTTACFCVEFTTCVGRVACDDSVVRDGLMTRADR